MRSILQNIESQSDLKEIRKSENGERKNLI